MGRMSFGASIEIKANLVYAARMSKPPRRISASVLENIALHYLERFDSSAENLRRVLMRRVTRAALHHGDDPAEGAALVTALVARFCANGLIDDARFAENRSRSLHRRGRPARAIRQTLAAKGVGGDEIAAALSVLAEDHDSAEDLAAARHYVRRRRLGPWRPPDERAACRDKDLAVLARAGFSWSVARTALEDSGAPDEVDPWAIG